MALETRDHVRLYDKVEALFLHYHNVYAHQTWQGVDVPLKLHDPLTIWSCEVTCQ